MASIAGMRGAALDVNRNYSFQEPNNINSVRTRLNERQVFELDQAANMHNQQLQSQLGKTRKINTGNKPDFDAFLKLLTEQLKHQDPLKPMEDKDFIAQMAQFSSLGEMVKFNTSMTQLLKDNQQMSQFNLLGKQVYWYHTSGDSRETRSGKVSAVTISDGNFEVVVGNQSIPVKNIFRVEAENNVQTTSQTQPSAQTTQNERESQNNTINTLHPSSAGLRAELHNKLNFALNQHIVEGENRQSN